MNCPWIRRSRFVKCRGRPRSCQVGQTGINRFEDTRPMDLSSDKSSLQLTPIISTSLSVIAPRMGWFRQPTQSTPKLYTIEQNMSQTGRLVSSVVSNAANFRQAGSRSHVTSSLTQMAVIDTTGATGRLVCDAFCSRQYSRLAHSYRIKWQRKSLTYT